jgi:uncharacterized MAPEG superfamily protein
MSNKVRLTLDKAVFQTMMVTTSVLAAKMFVTNFYSAFPSAFSGFAAPEDSWIFKKMFGVKHDQHHGKHAIHDTQAHAALLRAQRVIMNDLENIPMSVIIFWLSALANGTSESSKQVATLFTVFCGARCLHSVVYLLGIPGVRTAAFVTGAATAFQAMFLGLKGAGAI